MSSQKRNKNSAMHTLFLALFSHNESEIHAKGPFYSVKTRNIVVDTVNSVL